jgi:molybdopterin synthase sulfur carrier subunit
MTTELVYFAWVRERIGSGGETLAIPAGLATVADLLDWLATRSPGHAAALADRGAIRVAIDQDFVAADTALGSPAEIAIFPPVTGG